MLIDDELQRLYDIREYVSTRIRELKAIKRMTQKNDHKKDTQYGWMQASDLTPHLAQWDGTWVQLAQASGVSTRTIGKIKDGQTQYVREDIGDAIMMALGLPHISIEIMNERPINYKIPERPASHYYEE